jgi:hypothetical protein
LHERAVLVAQAGRQAVELRLHGEHRIGLVEPLLYPALEVPDFRVAEGIAERQHRHGVPHRGELRRRRVAHAHGRRVGIGEFGMFRLQRFELAHQPVVLGVRYRRIIEHMVAMVGVVDQAAQFGGAGGGLGGHPGILVRRSAPWAR